MRLKVLPFLSVLVCMGLAFSQERTVHSKVTHVTAYSDRAQITRHAEEKLPLGNHTLVFPGLPSTIFDRSVRVSGVTEGKGKILDVKVETVFLDSIPESRIRTLEERLKELKTEQKALEYRMAVVQSQKGFIDTVRISFARTPRLLNNPTPADFSGWEKMLVFLEKNLTAVNGKVMEIQGKDASLREKIVAIEREIQNSRAFSRRSQKEVHVMMAVEQGGVLGLDLSYVLPDAQWVPMYEARVESDSAGLQLTYSAQVMQNTSEDWSDIQLSLSTGQPSGGGLPELSAWFIDFGRPAPAPRPMSLATAKSRPLPGRGNMISGRVTDVASGEPLIGANVVVEGTNMGASTAVDGSFVIPDVPSGTYRVRAAYVGYSPYGISGVVVTTNAGPYLDFNLTSTAVQLDAVMITAERPVIQRNTTSTIAAGAGSQVTEQPTSHVFTIGAKATIPSDNVPHKITIAVVQLASQLSYRSVPRISKSAHMKAIVKNTSEYPFLPGLAAVFFENSFIATSSLGQVLSGEEFTLDLGTDEGVRTNRRLLNKFTEYTGTFTRKTKITYDYVINVENAKNVNLTLTLQEQIPISRNENILVEVLAPQKEELKPDEKGIFTWNLALRPGEKRQLKVQYSVEYPRDNHVSGLE